MNGFTITKPLQVAPDSVKAQDSQKSFGWKASKIFEQIVKSPFRGVKRLADIQQRERVTKFLIDDGDCPVKQGAS